MGIKQAMKYNSFKIVKQLARIFPPGMRRWVRQFIPATDYDLYLAEQADPFLEGPETWDATGSKFTIAISKEFTHYHKHYIRACREMGISYRLLDLTRQDWLETASKSGCDAILVWPSASLTVWKELFDERIYCLAKELDIPVYPSFEEIWIYENKRRVNYWLEAHQIAHPQTWIFYHLDEALAFARQAAVPLVLKTNTGASASGVFILRSRRDAETFIRRAFSHGIVARRHNPNDRHWGYVFLQEYLEIKREWRMVRIGNSYFGHPKGRRGDFHSGSGIAQWDVPPIELLELTRHITDEGRFTSMDVDTFETVDGRYLVNELQTLFGASTSIDQLRVDGKAGRFVKNELTGEWTFEAGDFARNTCANARLDYLINTVLPARCSRGRR
jgi:glutathione synthase/RimK-type ligase-like ATP-grasp enzyme